jgi:hypothetical protein
MGVWKKYLFLNAGMTFGFILSIFLVPGATPFWLLVLIAGVYVLYMNYSLYHRLANPNLRPSQRDDLSVTAIVVLLLLLDIAFSHL